MATGGEIVCSDDIYGGMYRLLTKVAAQQNVKVRFVPTYNIKLLEEVMAQDTEKKIKIVHLESPTNPLLRISDVQMLLMFAR